MINTDDFKQLHSLLAKLSIAADKATKEDGSFRKYNSTSIEALQHFRLHLSNLENGLKTTKLILPRNEQDLMSKSSKRTAQKTSRVAV